MFNVRLAGDHLYGKSLCTWLSLLMSFMVSYFVIFFFPHEMSWMRSGTELGQFLRPFLPALSSITIFFIMPPSLMYVLVKTKRDCLQSIGYLPYKARFVANFSSCTLNYQNC